MLRDISYDEQMELDPFPWQAQPFSRAVATHLVDQISNCVQEQPRLFAHAISRASSSDLALIGSTAADGRSSRACKIGYAATDLVSLLGCVRLRSKSNLGAGIDHACNERVYLG
jgi:hypothetical protein